MKISGVIGLIKWEEYKKLKKEEREEYKFKNERATYPKTNITSLFGFYLIFGLYTFTNYLILKDYPLNWKTSQSEIYILQMRITAAFLIVWAIDYIGQMINHIYKLRKIRKWLNTITKKTS